MPYRHIHSPENLCVMCSTSTSTSCRNCNTPHCGKHLLGASCVGCTSRLWAIERRQVRKLSFLWATIAPLPIIAGLGGLLNGSAIPVSAVPILMVVMTAAALAMTLLSRGIIRRRLATRSLTPSSRPLSLPAPSDSVENNEAPTARPRSRAMHTKRRGPPRAVFMTRGGYFYQ